MNSVVIPKFVVLVHIYIFSSFHILITLFKLTTKKTTVVDCMRGLVYALNDFKNKSRCSRFSTIPTNALRGEK